MKKSVLITAVSGTGKSTVCKALNASGYDSIDIESVDDLYELVNEKTGEIVPGNLEQISEGVDWNCNKLRLKKLVDIQTSELAFYCGGMSNTFDVWDVFDFVIMLTVSDEATIKRLSTRRLGEFGSTKVNRNWVLSWKHGFEKRLLNAGAVPVSAEANPKEVVRLILSVVDVVNEG
ncbi:MAG: AAA family ATPase [Candidatus Woesebacteria bacterium]|jgi:broad-specificity NMP kinase